VVEMSASDPTASETGPAANDAAAIAPIVPPRSVWTRISVLDLLTRYGVLIAWLIVIAFFSVQNRSEFLTVGNFQTIFGSQAVVLILTLGLLPSLTAGEFDLSIAGVMSLSLVLVGYLNVVEHWPILPTVVVALSSGLAVGLANSLFVIVVGVPSIVVTLGTGTLLIGLGVAINESTTGGISSSLVNVAQTQIFGLPLAFFYGLALTLIVWYVFSFTPLGRYLYFVGANRSVARLSGLRVDAIRAGSLVTTSFISALAGVIFAGTLGSSDPNISTPFLLPAFAAAFLGSTAVTPGRFNPWGTFIAVYFLITGITGLELMGLSGWVEDVFYGASLVLAVTLSQLASKYQLQRRMAAAAASREEV
jgi:ribose transport system permease protein